MPPRISQMQECPQCRKLFDPVPTSGDFCPDCADAIRDEFEIPAVFHRIRTRCLDLAGPLFLTVSRLKDWQLKDTFLAKKSRLKAVLVFVIHQFVGTWGIAFFAYFSGTSLLDFLSRFGLHPSMRSLQWILTETPYYPVQLALGLFCGVFLGRRYRHRSMMWVWIIPLFILCFAVATNYTLIPEWTSVLARFGQSRWSHFFGWGCHPANRCLDQLEITMPFYVSVAYSLGGLMGQRVFDKN